MNCVEYQDAARSTAVYPNKVEFLYPSLGLAGEVGELCEKLGRDDPCDEIMKEVGDVLWYVANVALDCGLLLHLVAEEDDFDKITPLFAINMPGELATHAGKVCEMAKKAARDDGGEISDERREKVREGLRDVLRTLVGICIPWDFTLTKAADRNIEKLKSRQERGVLKGSGDNR